MTKKRKQELEEYVSGEYSRLLREFGESFEPHDVMWKEKCKRIVEQAGKLGELFGQGPSILEAEEAFISLFDIDRCGHNCDCRGELYEDRGIEKLILSYVKIFQVSLTPELVAKAYLTAATATNGCGMELIQKISKKEIPEDVKVQLRESTQAEYKERWRVFIELQHPYFTWFNTALTQLCHEFEGTAYGTGVKPDDELVHEWYNDVLNIKESRPSNEEKIRAISQLIKLTGVQPSAQQIKKHQEFYTALS